MNSQVIYNDLKSIEFGKAWDIQKELIARVQKTRMNKQDGESGHAHYLLFCEHPHVFTLGKSGSEKNLLVNADVLQKKGVSFYHIDRGGDITYHGPGQIVGYPIFDLDDLGMGVKKYVNAIEEVIIRMLAGYGIHSGRMKGAAGVWLEPDKPDKSRKICAIGVKVSHSVTMHGFALNVNPDLNYFNFINPCGFTDKAVTSMEKETGVKQDLDEVKMKLRSHFSTIFGVDYQNV
jgi:lipoyl(octanoyl) transferase